MDSQKPKKAKPIEIELKEEETTGTYSNLVLITHSPAELLFDIISMMRDVKKAKAGNRLNMTPDHAKRLAKALHDNIRKFEAENGPISIRDKVETPFHYRGPKAQA